MKALLLFIYVTFARGLFGLGYVGAVSAACFLERYEVINVDNN